MLLQLLLTVALSIPVQNIQANSRDSSPGPAQVCVKFLKWYFKNQPRLNSSYKFTNGASTSSSNPQINFKEVNRYLADISSSGYASDDLLQHIKACFEIVADSLKKAEGSKTIVLPDYAREPVISNANAEVYIKQHIDSLKIAKAKWEDDLNVYWLSLYAGHGLRLNFDLTGKTGKWQVSSCYVWKGYDDFTAKEVSKFRTITNTYPAKFIDKPAYHIVINKDDHTPAGICINFLKWYIKNERRLNYKYETVDFNGFDSTKIYTVNYAQIRGLLAEFKKSGFVSTIYLDHIQDIYKKAEKEIRDNHINDGRIEALKTDLVMQDMEEGLRQAINKLKIIYARKNGEAWQVKLKADKKLFYLFTVKQYGQRYLLDTEQIAWQ